MGRLCRLVSGSVRSQQYIRITKLYGKGIGMHDTLFLLFLLHFVYAGRKS